MNATQTKLVAGGIATSIGIGIGAWSVIGGGERERIETGAPIARDSILMPTAIISVGTAAMGAYLTRGGTASTIGAAAASVGTGLLVGTVVGWGLAAVATSE